MDSIRNRWSNSRLSALLGIKYPIVQGPFGGGSSTIKMASAISECGGLGGYGAQSLSGEQIRDLVAEFKTATTAPFAVNLWVPLPGEREYRLTPAEFERQMSRLRPYYDELNVKEPEFSPTFGQSYDAQIELLLESR
ncbi:MAG: nitronate monooxygenase, partial [Thermomicrobiales bacterium]